MVIGFELSAVDISHDGKTIATGGDMLKIKVGWDVVTKEEIRMLQGNLVKFSPDGTLLATAYGTEITLWTMDGKEIFL